MKKHSILIIFLLIFSSIFCQNQDSNIEYFDDDGKKITKNEYVEKIKSRLFTTIVTDTTKNVYLVKRIQAGEITNKKIFDSLIKKEFAKKYDPNLPTVIVYYPGKDNCNSANNGSNWNPIKNRYYNELEKGLRKRGKYNIFYVYKSKKGLKDGNKGYKKWHSDPENIFEKLFFRYHYPCNSYVIIKPNGKYISILGESGKETVWKMYDNIDVL